MQTQQAQVSEPSSTVTRTQRAYREVAPEARRLPAHLIERLHVHVPSFSAAVTRKLPAIRSVRADVLAAMAPHEMVVFDALEDRLLALREADTLYDSLPKVAHVTPAMRALRSRFKVVGLEYARLLALGELAPTQHDPLVYTPSQRQLISNTFMMTSQLRRAWPRIAGKCSFAVSVLDTLEATAVAAEAAAVQRARDHQAAEAASDLRNRIYTLVLQSIRNVRKAVGYLDRSRLGTYAPQFRNASGG